MFIQLGNLRINTDYILKYEIPDYTASYSIRIDYNRDMRCGYENTYVIFYFNTKEELDKTVKLLDTACDVRNID